MWTDSSLERRYLVLRQLTGKELRPLQALRQRALPAWGETDDRWSLLHQIDAPSRDVIERLPASLGRRIGGFPSLHAHLLAWLWARRPGTWALEVEPERGERLLAHLDDAVLAGFPLVDPPARLDTRAAFARQYDGDWQAVLDAIPTAQCEALAARFDAEGPDPRSALGRWLVRRIPFDQQLNVDDPVPPIRGRVRTYLQYLGVSTVADLLVLAPPLPRVKSIGAVPTQAEVFEQQAAARRRVTSARAISPPAAPQPTDRATVPRHESLAALLADVLRPLDARTRALVVARYSEAKTLSEIAGAHDLSRERIRQIVASWVSSIRPATADEALRLLVAEWHFGALGPDVLHRDLGAASTVPFADLPLATALLGTAWTTAGDWHYRHGVLPELSAAAIEAAGDRRILTDAAITALHRRDPRLIPDLVRRLLADAGWQTIEGGMSNDTRSLGEHLAERVQLARGPVPTRTAAAWWQELGATGPISPSRMDTVLARQPKLWPLGRGAWCHEDHLPVPVDRLERMADFCAQRLAGKSAPTSTLTLLTALAAGGFDTTGIHPYLLKRALARRPDVLALRKTYVAWRQGYTPSSVAPQAAASAQIRLDFWSAFGRYLDENGPFRARRMHALQHDMSWPIGFDARVMVRLDVRDGTARIGLMFHRLALQLYPGFVARRAEVEAALGVHTTWWTTRDTAFVLTPRDVPFTDPAAWPAAIAGLVEEARRFQRIARPFLSAAYQEAALVPTAS